MGIAKQAATPQGVPLWRLARRACPRIHAAIALQVDSRLEGLSNRNAKVFSAGEDPLASARLEGTLLREPRPLLA